MTRTRPSLFKSIIVGALWGLVAFALEGALILRNNAIGLNIDVKGPFAALLAVVKPQLPWLLGRVAMAYAAAGATGGVLAALLTRLYRIRSAPLAWLVWWGNWLLLVLFVCVDHAIARPALFDDLPWLTNELHWLVDHGDFRMLRGAAAAVLAVQCVAAFAVSARWRDTVFSQVRFAVTAGLLGLVGASLCATTFIDPREVPASSSSSSSSSKPRLIVLIGIDAFRIDRLKSQGGTGKVAPNLEAFLSDATLFTNAWTPIAQTEPAWRSIVTARWPFRTGVRYPLTPESHQVAFPTFPSQLNAEGWATSFTTDCSRFNYLTAASGFEDRHEPPRGAINFALEKLRFRLLGVFADNALGARALPEFVENRALAGVYDPVGFARRLGDRIARVASQRPAFFAYHSVEAHFPGDPSYPFYRARVPVSSPLARRLRMFFSPITAHSAGPVDGWGRAESEEMYDELIGQADAQVGIVIDTLKARGLYDDAAIIVFSDHGESFHADHPELAGATPVHGARLSREENRILLAVKLPKGSARRIAETGAFVRLIDLGPTILELAHAPALKGADGESLLPILRGEPSAARKLYAETGFTHASPGAFDPGHLAVAPRTFDIYQVQPDGVVTMTESAGELALKEKDIGAFDGATWIIRTPRSDGTVREDCSGQCPAPALSQWLDATVHSDLVERHASTAVGVKANPPN